MYKGEQDHQVPLDHQVGNKQSSAPKQGMLTQHGMFLGHAASCVNVPLYPCFIFHQVNLCRDPLDLVVPQVRACSSETQLESGRFFPKA